jgi:hypothetical protein
MTALIFKEWFKDFNAKMIFEERKLLLILDNASSHRADISLTKLNYFCLLILQHGFNLVMLEL